MKVLAFEFLILLLAGTAAAAPAADITGKWTAETLLSASGSETPTPTTFTFKVEGDTLAGTVSSDRGEHEIADGKIDGDSITFSVLVGGDGGFKMFYDGRVGVDGIDFISKVEGRDRSDHFLATRVPE